MQFLSEPNHNHNPNNKTTITAIGLRPDLGAHKNWKLGREGIKKIDNFWKKGKGKGNGRPFFDKFTKLIGIGMGKGNVYVNF